MKRKILRRGTATLLTVILTLASCLTTAALGTLPDKNTAVRHQVCTSLTEEAKAYYNGVYDYARLSRLDGAESTATSYEAMQGNKLFDALHTLMTDTHQFYTGYSGYKNGSLAYFWASTDTTATSDNYVMFYSDIPSGGDVQMNREHIWPKSHASFYTSGGGADLHHLRPSVASLNLAKSDHIFGDINGVFTSGYTEGTIDGEVLYYVNKDADLFECKDDVKGDVARILLYVYCRWLQPNLYSTEAAHLPAFDADDTTNNGVKVIESLDTLLQWCETDPVDEWEMRRNDLTEEVQGNRNVFIDYPELAWQLFDRELPAGMATPTHIGCPHQYSEVARTQAGCTDDGVITERCNLCGNELTHRLAALGHSDQNEDEICDRCEQPLTIPADMTKATELHDGDHVVIYHPSTKTTVNDELATISAKVRGNVCHPTPDCAVMTAEVAENEMFYLKHNDCYLTVSETVNQLSFRQTPDAGSLWKLTSAETNGQVYIDNANGKRLKIYAGKATNDYAGTTPAYRFELYTRSEHYEENGKCLLCGETMTAPLLGDTDGDDKVTITDVTTLQKYLADYEMPDSFCLRATDANGDGVVNIEDATEIQKWLASLPSNEAIGKPITNSKG